MSDSTSYAVWCNDITGTLHAKALGFSFEGGKDKRANSSVAWDLVSSVKTGANADTPAMRVVLTDGVVHTFQFSDSEKMEAAKRTIKSPWKKATGQKKKRNDDGPESCLL